MSLARLLRYSLHVFLRPRNYARAWRVLRQRGIAGFSRTVLDHLWMLWSWRNTAREPPEVYQYWIKRHDTLTSSDLEALRALTEQMERRPTHLILIINESEDTDAVHATLDSLEDQVYPHWSAVVIAVSSPSEVPLSPYLQDQRVAQNFARDWVEAWNAIIDQSEDDLILTLRAGDRLAPDALYCVSRRLVTDAGLRVVYTDHDLVEPDGNRHSHNFKPDWNRDWLYTRDDISMSCWLERSLVTGAQGMRQCSGAERFDLLLRCVMRISDEAVAHIPQILTHCAARPAGLHADEDTEVQVLRAAFDNMSPAPAICRQEISHCRHLKWPLPASPPLVSIIIPTRNRHDLLKVTIDSIREKTRYQPYEILIVDNQSDDPETQAYLRALANDAVVRIQPYDQPFNYSAICNAAVQAARGEVVAFLNNDIEIITAGWLEEMAAHALRPAVGAVGAKMYYPDDRIQHAGVMMGFGEAVDPVAGHAFHLLHGQQHGYHCRASLTQRMTAVTAACMVIRKEVYLSAGGLNEEHLPVNYNDVDLCLKLEDQGLMNIYTPHAQLYHHQSATRGADHGPEQQRRFRAEVTYMHRTWGERLHSDRSLNPNLTWVHGDCRLCLPPRLRLRPWRDKSGTADC